MAWTAGQGAHTLVGAGLQMRDILALWRLIGKSCAGIHIEDEDEDGGWMQRRSPHTMSVSELRMYTMTRS